MAAEFICAVYLFMSLSLSPSRNKRAQNPERRTQNSQPKSESKFESPAESLKCERKRAPRTSELQNLVLPSGRKSAIKQPTPLCNCHRNFYIILKQSQKKVPAFGKVAARFPSPKTREPQSGVAEFELTTL